jgi:tol-pal system protein YbgF
VKATRSLVLSASCAAMIVLSLGCLTPEQIVALQKDVSDIRQDVEALRKESQQNSARVEEVRGAVVGKQDESRAQAAESKRQVDAIRDDLRSIDSRLDEMQRRLSGVTQSMPGPGSGRATPGVSAAGARSDQGDPTAPVSDRAAGGPDALFNQAYADYSKGNYAAAMLGFEEYLKQYPKTERCDDALYWIGLCHYDQGEYQEAVAEFDRLIQEYPAGDKVPSAHLKKGLSLLGMNRTAQGVVQLQYLIEHFPKSDEARIATDRLREIGVKP